MKTCSHCGAFVKNELPTCDLCGSASFLENSNPPEEPTLAKLAAKRLARDAETKTRRDPRH